MGGQCVHMGEVKCGVSAAGLESTIMQMYVMITIIQYNVVINTQPTSLLCTLQRVPTCQYSCM